MSSDQSLSQVLRYMSTILSEYVSGRGRPSENEKKFVLLDPVSLPKPTGEEPRVFNERDLAINKKTQLGADNHVMGPVVLVYDVSRGIGWSGTELIHMTVVEKNLIITGLRHEEPEIWHYPNSEFETFLIVVSKSAD